MARHWLAARVRIKRKVRPVGSVSVALAGAIAVSTVGGIGSGNDGSATLTGVSAASAVNTASVTTVAAPLLAGVSATRGIGTVTASGKGTATPLGIAAPGTAQPLAVVVSGPIINLTGNGATGSTNAIGVIPKARIFPTGIAATGAAGTVTDWGWQTIPAQSATVGTPYSLTLANYDPPGTESYSVDGSGDALPAGLSLNTSTGAVTGTPTTAQVRNVRFIATKADQGATITTLTLAGGGTGKPWTFGQPFKQGDVPSGQYLMAVGPASFQAEVRNRWSDGSVKYAVLSGIGGTSAELHATTTAPSGSNVAEPSTTASVQFTAPATTVQLATARTNGSMAWTKATAHKVREILGPVMSEFHYYSPVSGDNHLAVWWHVRAYVDGSVWVETIVENGWARVASPAEKVYTITVTVAGIARQTGSLVHYHHTRWSRRDWAGTDPAITPSHNSAYFRATKLVSNYDTPAVSGSYLSGLPQTPAPFNRFTYDVASDGGGAAPYLGILPAWCAAYVQSGDSRAYAAMLCNEQAANCCNIDAYSGCCTRDETTGLPANLPDFYSDSYSNWYSPTYGGKVYNGTNSTINAGSGATYVWKTDKAHSTAQGYLEYLVTGRWFSLETSLLTTAHYFIASGVSSTSSPQPTRLGQDRAVGWQLRNEACAGAIVPDWLTSLRNGYISHMSSFWSYWRTNEVGQNNLGIRQNIYNNVDYGPAPYNTCGAFQQQFLAQAFAFGYDLQADNVDATTRTRWYESVQFHCTLAVGLLGVRPGGYSFRRAGLYALVCGPDRTKPLTSGDFFASFGEMYDANVTTGAIPAGEAYAETGANSTMLYGSNDPYNISATSYFANLRPAAAYAVDFGVTGAAASWARFTGNASWPNFWANFTSDTQFGISPR